MMECFPTEETEGFLNSEIITKQNSFIKREQWLFDQFMNHVSISGQKNFDKRKKDIK
jgi:hypothetical protein